MQLSETIKLYPTKQQKDLILKTMAEYINTVNGLVSDAVSGVSIAKTTSAGVEAELPIGTQKASRARNPKIQRSGNVEVGRTFGDNGAIRRCGSIGRAADL